MWAAFAGPEIAVLVPIHTLGPHFAPYWCNIGAVIWGITCFPRCLHELIDLAARCLLPNNEGDRHAFRTAVSARGVTEAL